MKTAMQELIIDLMIHLEHEIGARLNIERFATFLEKEKEQIIDAYTEGYTNWDSEMTSVEYYNQTYNQNK